MPRRKIETADSVPVNGIDIKTGKPAELPSVPAICRRIRQFRMQKRLEQKELASVLGISGNTVCNWENGRGRPDLNLIPPLCAVLGISLADLFGAEEETAR